MNKNISQRGSAHAVIIICLVLALMTALGWIFYQNFIFRKDTGGVAVNKSQDKAQQPEGNTDASNTFRAKYFTINRPASSELLKETKDGMAEYVEFARVAAGSNLTMSVAVYDGKYDNASEGTSPIHSYVPIADWYDQQGAENVGGSDGDFLMRYNHKLTRERGQTNRAVIYILKGDTLYKIVLQEGDEVVFENIESSDGPAKGSATYKFSAEIKQILASFKITDV